MRPSIGRTVYLQAQIDTRTRQVRSVLISSDERPTMVKSHLVWALLTTAYGFDYAAAREKMLAKIGETPHLQWCKPLLQ